MKTALVAGGAGFIGSHLCEVLIADGWRVACLDSLRTGRLENLSALARERRFEFVAGDVIDGVPAALAGLGVERVYNLACPASPPAFQADPEHTLLSCVLGTRNLLRFAERHRARFLLSSTSEVYGDPEVHPQPESYRGWTSCTGPRACYDEGKRAAETLAFDFQRLGRVDVRVPRIFNTYGPRMRPDDGRIVSNFICQALAGEDITIYGDGSQTRSFCYVSDLVDGLVRLMESGIDDGPVNLGNPAEISVRDIAAQILELTGSSSRTIHRPLPEDDPRRRWPDIGRAIERLGWEPKVDLRTGLEATAAWLAEERARLASGTEDGDPHARRLRAAG